MISIVIGSRENYLIKSPSNFYREFEKFNKELTNFSEAPEENDISPAKEVYSIFIRTIREEKNLLTTRAAILKTKNL